MLIEVFIQTMATSIPKVFELWLILFDLEGLILNAYNRMLHTRFQAVSYSEFVFGESLCLEIVSFATFLLACQFQNDILAYANLM